MKPYQIKHIQDAGELFGQALSAYANVRRTFGVTTEALLSQFLYWQGKEKDPDGWIYKRMAEIEFETGLTEKEIETARKKLRSIGVLSEKRKGCPPVVYFKFDWQRATDLLAAQREMNLSRGEVSELGQTVEIENLDNSTNEPNQLDPNGLIKKAEREQFSYIQENTSKNTSNNNNIVETSSTSFERENLEDDPSKWEWVNENEDRPQFLRSQIAYLKSNIPTGHPVMEPATLERIKMLESELAATSYGEILKVENETNLCAWANPLSPADEILRSEMGKLKESDFMSIPDVFPTDILEMRTILVANGWFHDENAAKGLALWIFKNINYPAEKLIFPTTMRKGYLEDLKRVWKRFMELKVENETNAINAVDSTIETEAIQTTVQTKKTAPRAKKTANKPTKQTTTDMILYNETEIDALTAEQASEAIIEAHLNMVDAINQVENNAEPKKNDNPNKAAHGACVKWFCETFYLETYKTKYHFAPKDAKAVKELLKFFQFKKPDATQNQLAEMFKLFVSKTTNDFVLKNSHSLTIIWGQQNQIFIELQNKKANVQPTNPKIQIVTEADQFCKW